MAETGFIGKPNSAQMTQYVVHMPHALEQNAYASLNNVKDGKNKLAYEMRIIGEGLTLEQYVLVTFFDYIKDPEREGLPMLIPVYFKKTDLDNLKGWEAWHTLTEYLGGFGLAPYLFFRNTPLKVRGFDVYIGDIRVVFEREG